MRKTKLEMIVIYMRVDIDRYIFTLHKIFCFVSDDCEANVS